jgi:hypothetical protein
MDSQLPFADPDLAERVVALVESILATDEPQIARDVRHHAWHLAEDELDLDVWTEVQPGAVLVTDGGTVRVMYGESELRLPHRFDTWGRFIALRCSVLRVLSQRPHAVFGVADNGILFHDGAIGGSVGEFFPSRLEAEDALSSLGKLGYSIESPAAR